MNGSATLTGTGVTLVFTSSGNNYASATINGGATVNLTAPATGSTAGIVLFGDRNKRLSRQIRIPQYLASRARPSEWTGI